jgi:16S rRNA (cytosine1402-N4)-methyltransferase
MTDSTSNNSNTPVRKRRVRYAGKHPRRFEEKYKELDPEQYADDVKKVLESGKTPAGSHRSICVQEVLEVLLPRPGMIALDATLGYGGHAREILARIKPGGCLWGIDVDPIEIRRTEARLRDLGYTEEQFKARRINFAGVPKLLTEAGDGFDIILADLGVSSMQLDDPARGFTFKREGPLDLRLNPERGQPASAFLKSLSEEEFEELLIKNADEPYAHGIARAVFKCRNGVSTTTALADAVRRALPRATSDEEEEERTRSIRRTFQALRIAVNDEFGVLEQFLRNLPLCLKPGGRAAILTFHSGEDNRVMRAFEEGISSGVYADMSREPIRATAQERRDNPRSKSAILRWVQSSSC